jgi:hypothetical protein
MALTKVTYSMIEGSPINVTDYGADPSGVIDSTNAIQSALDAADNINGGIVFVPNGSKFLIDNNLTIPANVSFVGPQEFVGSPGNNTSADYTNVGGTLILNSAKTITLSSNSSITGLLIYRKGMTFPASNASNFLGTAITVSGDDATVARCMILGFAKAIYSSNSQRPKFQDLNIDCSAGIEITVCFDIPRLTNIHCWPFTTVGAIGTNEKNHRSGSAFYLHDSVDGPMLASCFSYGYLNGFYFKNVSTILATNCFADNTGLYTNSAGWLFEGNINGFSTSDCATWSSESGITINTIATQYVPIISFTIQSCTANGINILQGISLVFNNFINNCNAGVYVDKTSSIVTIRNNTFGVITTDPVVINTLTNNVFIEQNIYLNSPTATFVTANDSVFQLSSANPLPIRNYGEVFNVTGTVGFSQLQFGWAGRKVTLVFDGILTITSATGSRVSMRLSGNVNFTTSAGATLTLAHNGTQWFEIGRSA